MEKLSNELLQGILCHLPVKCLLRLKCVSKNWLAIINSPDFVKLHLKKSVQTKNNLGLYLTSITTGDHFNSDFYSLDFNSLEDHQDNLLLLQFNKDPLNHLNYRTEIWGSCNGMFCLSNLLDIKLLWSSQTKRFVNMSRASLGELANQPVEVRQYSSHGFGYVNTSYNPIMRQNYSDGLGRFGDGYIEMEYTLEIVALWNPSTRKSIKLPVASVDIPNQFNLHKRCIYGFGYDENSDDYKVVRVLIAFGHDDYEVKVYSLRSNSWHTSNKYPDQYPEMDRTENTVVGGAMHWMSKSRDNRLFILAFDLGTETYRVIQQPQYLDLHFVPSLSSLGGYLLLTCRHDSGIVEVWLLKEYGGENESWSRLAQNIPFSSDKNVEMVDYSKNGKKVLLNLDYNLVMFDIESNSLGGIISLISLQDDEFNDEFNQLNFRVTKSCLESLVSLDVAGAG